jgi:hypothetical protein
MFRRPSAPPTFKTKLCILGRTPPRDWRWTSPDHDLVLPEFPLQLTSVPAPPRGVEGFGHDLEHNDLVMYRFAFVRRRILGGRSGKCRHSAEPLNQVFANGCIFFRAERPSAVVVERKE